MGRVKSILRRRDGLGKGTVGIAGCLQRTSSFMSTGNQKQSRWPEMCLRRCVLPHHFKEFRFLMGQFTQG